MAQIVAARAWCNNEVAYLAWKADAKIPDCLGFMITRVHLDDSGNEVDRRLLPTWVSFNTQSNPDWVERDTSTWPIQKFTWRDLTLRRSRDTLDVRPAGFSVRYEIVPVGKAGPGRAAVPPSPLPQPGTYKGDPIPLFVCGTTATTNTVTVTTDVVTGQQGKPLVTVGFTNGILSTQNLRQQLKTPQGQPPTKKQLTDHIDTKADDPIRTFLSADALTLMRGFMARAKAENCDLYMALYELNDPLLLDLIKQNADRVHLILSTAGSSKPPKGSGQKPTWDTTNTQSRKDLRSTVAEFHDRMFNNSAHIGHNKFAVLVDRGTQKAKAVLSGSTNWTFTGLCTQSNNVIILDDAGAAGAYLTYWQRLRDDKLSVPTPISAPNSNKQGPKLRTEDMQPISVALGNQQAKLELWYSPNTKSATKTPTSPTPPDLKDVYALMSGAKSAIFFLTFKPSNEGKQSIIEQALDSGIADTKLLVLGAISDGTALPGADDDSAAPAAAKGGTSRKGGAAKGSAAKRSTAKRSAAKRTPSKKKAAGRKATKKKARPTARRARTVAMAQRASVIKSPKAKPAKAAKAKAAKAKAAKAKPAKAKAAKSATAKSTQPRQAKRAIYTNPKAPKVLMIRAAAISDFDLIGDWEQEMLRYGQAIIHDKIIVIDPLSDDCVVVTGSHNLGYKASYANDENMLIIRGNKEIAAAYAVHVLDVYDHYKFRAILEDRVAKGAAQPERGHGILQTDDTWQDDYFNGKKGEEVEYFLGGNL